MYCSINTNEVKVADNVVQVCGFADIFFFLVQSIAETQVLKSLAVIGELSISPFNSVNSCFNILKFCCGIRIHLD